MKKLCSVIVLAMFIFAVTSPVSVKAQFLKNVLNSVKNTVQNKADDKASQATNKAIDNVDGTNKTKANKTTITTPATSSKTDSTSAGSRQASPNFTDNKASGDSGSSYVKVKLSSNKILAGGTVIISGSSVMYESLNKVAVTISGPSVNESKNIALNTDGSFSTTWLAANEGSYTITVKSSDGKDHASITVSVYKFAEMEVITGPGKEETKKAYDNLKNSVDQLKTQLVQSDADELQKKMDDVTQKKELVLKLFTDLDAMGKGMDAIEKKSGPLPPDISSNLSQVTDQLSAQATQMETANEMADYKPTDNTICEYLVMANEACAAFSTFTNVWAKTLGGVLKNIAIDKVSPLGADAANNQAKAGGDAANIHKQCDKVATAAIYDAESLTSKLSIASFAGDLAQMCIDHFLKKYCVVMSGELSHDYQCTFRNKDGVIWWQHNYSTGATISLRYPKNNSGGNIIKMKGNIEGNATKFSIYQKASEIDEFKEAMKNRAKLYSLELYKPTAVPFSTSQKDKLGFGAVARAIATPAYFNIPIDADYDVAAKKLKIYLNTPLMDFNPHTVIYIYAYLTFPLSIPLVTRVDYPINNVKLTLGKVIEKNNDFDIKTGADNNLFFSKNGNFKIGDASSAIEHNIDFAVSAKGQ